MSEVDPDPYEPGEGQGESSLGGAPVPDAGDPTDGGRRGEIGEAPGIAADEPDGWSRLSRRRRIGTEERNAPPVADPGPDA